MAPSSTSRLFTTDVFSLGMLNPSPVAHYLNIPQGPASQISKHLSDYNYRFHASYCHFTASAAAIPSELGFPAYVSRRKWYLHDYLHPDHYPQITVIRQILPILPHGTELTNADIFAYPSRYALISDQFLTTETNLPPIFEDLNKSHLAYCFDAFSLAQLTLFSAITAQRVPAGTALSVIASGSPRFVIRHHQTALYLSALLGQEITSVPLDTHIAIPSSPEFTFALVMQISDIVKFGEILSAESLASSNINWWLLRIYTR